VGSGRGRSEGAELEGENKRGDGPQIALAYRLVQFHRGPQNSRLPAPTPPPTSPHKYLPASKPLRMGPYKS
jgi:hypothetical protein